MDGFLQANQSLMRQFGIDSTYSVVTQGAYDPNSGQVVNTSTDYTIKVRASLPKLSETQQPHLVGKQVANLYILPQSFVPSVNDKVLVGTDKYTVSDLTTQYGYAGTIIGYKMLCIKG